MAFVLSFIHGPKIRSTFCGSLRPYQRVKTRKSIYLENINPNELNVIFSQIVSEGFNCDKVWGISIFPSCIPIRGIKSKSLLNIFHMRQSSAFITVRIKK